MKDDLISRSALEKEGFTHFIRVTAGGKVVRSKKIAEAPAVDPEEVFKSLPYVEKALEMAKQSMVPVVRCKDCDVPHNRWTGCPNLNGMIPPPDFYCASGVRKTEV